MAVKRQQNWLGQQRVDVAHLRAVESGVANDFDVVAGIMLTGKLPVVISGFEVLTTSAIGNDATALVLRVAGGSLIHYEAAESGSVFWVSEDSPDEVLGSTNPTVQGSFTPNATNFVGIDLYRIADDETADTVQFLSTDTSSESATIAPLARTLQYSVVVSTTEFSATPGILPVAKVVTDGSNKVISITDARNLMFRLGSGGSNPLAVNPYGWPGGRDESDSALANVAGDRSIASLKEWMSAVMSRMWEIGGGEFWYSPVADRNVSMVSNSVFTSTGEPFEIVSNNIHWTGIRFVFDNSTATTNEVSDQLASSVGLTDLADGECIYVDLDRTANRTVAGLNALTAQKGLLSSLGISSRPGQRHVMAWRTGSTFYTRNQYLPIGSALRVATTAAVGAVKLSGTPSTPLAPVVATIVTSFLAGIGGFTRRNTGTLGDLFIGTGDAATEQNIYLTPGPAYATFIQAYTQYSLNQRAALRVVQNGTGSNWTDGRILDLNGTVDGALWKNRLSVESGGAVLIAPWEVPPGVPAPTSVDPARMKLGSRPSRYWKADCRLAVDENTLPSHTYSGSGASRTMTATANGLLSVDGFATIAGNRILVYSGVTVPQTGIYVVTQAGTAGTPWILTRAADCCDGLTIFNDIAVKITTGTVWGGTAFAARCIDNATSSLKHSTFVVETDYMFWDQIPSTITTDMLVVKWHDGSETVLAQSPPYFV